MSATPVKLIECPRDAIQGWPHPVSTTDKVDYLNALLAAGFDTLDCGSFVSPKAIPQMADTAMVIPQLQTQTQTKLLTIVANERGATEALQFPQIHYLGFPFSVSETFQQRNTNSSIVDSLDRVKAIQALCLQHQRELVVYLSMGFGNPYGDPYNESIVEHWALQLHALGIRTLSLADTVGVASPDQVMRITTHLVQLLPDTEIGVHLHSTAANWSQKLEAAYDAGCRRFDGALLGIGGCPMAKDELVGNMNTLWMIDWFAAKGVLPRMDQPALNRALDKAVKNLPGMTLSFTKFPDKPPVFEVTRDDGSTCWQSSTPFFVLHDLSHYALEKTLGYRTAFLGMVNNGMTLDAFEDRESRSRIQVTEEAWYAECMANLFLTELSQGPFTDFNAVCAATFTAMNQPYPPPVLSETTLQRIRDLLSGLRTQWEALAPKSSLTLTF